MNLASLPGVVLDGKYRIERQLGKGGMGAVFQAIHLGTTRTVAVKVIVPRLAAQDEFVLRFQREAEAAGRLRHPNVVNVTDFGSTMVDGGQLAYLVMEYLDGQNLSDFLGGNPHPATDEIVEIVDQVALALDTAHASGIVHRDLKPDNIWLQPNGRGGFNVKVLDFGIAKLHNPAGASPTAAAGVAKLAGAATMASQPAPSQPATTASTAESETLAMPPTVMEPAEPGQGEAETVVTYVSLRAASSPAGGSLRLGGSTNLETTVGSVLGTPAYMAPEQCQGANVDTSADIYSLSVIVYQMFCGCLPFEARSLKELLQKQIEEQPVPPAVRDPGIPQRVSAAILRGLEKRPAARPATALGFAAQLRAAAQGEVKLLADGKVVANNYGNSFFPLLLACFAPQIPILGALYLAATAITATKMVPAGVVTAVFQLLLFGVQYFLSQMYKAGTTLLLNDAGAAGHFEQQWRSQFGKLVRGLGSLSATHLRNLFDVRPRSFLAGQLWPIVWASEGLSGKAALARAAHLAGTEPGVAAALAVRQCGILLATALFTPWMLTMMAGSTDAYVTLVTGPKNPLVWFAIVYPTILSVLLFRFFGPSFFFLYLSARRCLAEDVRFSLPSENRERRKRRAARLRPGTKAWLALPTVLSAMLLYKIIPHAKSSRALLDAALEGRKTAVLRELDSGVPVNSSDRRGWTPLMWAVDGGHMELVRELVTRRADLNARNGSGDTALLVALWHRRTAEAELLMAGGADVKIANDDGRTALDVAAMHGDLDMCKRLLAWGADRTHRDLKDQTALDSARAEGYQEVVSLLSTPTLISPGASR